IAIGSKPKLVSTTTATPILAAIASSWITSMLMTIRVVKPMASEINAVKPAMYSERKARRAASILLAPSTLLLPIALIIWTPWLTPMAKTKNGTSIEYGLIPEPISLMIPSCQITAIIEQIKTANEPTQQRLYQNNRMQMFTIATTLILPSWYASTNSPPSTYAKLVI